MTLVGTVITLPDPVLAELIGAAFDVAWIDLEHGALGVDAVPALAVALRAAGCRADVRLPSWSSEALPPVADAGVDGVVAPCVESADEAEAFAARLRYPPSGTRGFGPRRAGGYGRSAAASPRCTVQIESVAGVESAAAIAAAEGVDALVVGCADLSLSLGERPGVDSPRLQEAVGRVRRAARGAGVAFGIAGGADGSAGDGADLVLHSVDVRLYARGADVAATSVRRSIA